MRTGTDVKVIQVAIPLSKKDRRRIDERLRSGMKKGHWVAEAIREKLEREEAKSPA